jgi:hypothetical protein
MDVLNADEIRTLVSSSSLAGKYAVDVDRESAYEILTAKLEEAARQSAEEASRRKPSEGGRTKAPESILDNTIVRQAGRTAASIITRSLLGALGLNTGRSRKKGLFG